MKHTLHRAIRITVVLLFVAATARAEPDVFALGDGHSDAGTISALNTQVNVYTPVTATVMPGDTDVNVGSSAGFKVGDLVMLWQSRSPTLQPAAGDGGGIDLGAVQAGFWELGRVTALTATVLTFRAPFETAFTGGAAQAITVPEFTNLTIQAAASLVPAAWNGSSGGVLAFLANGTVLNDGVINAVGAGFRGGVAVKASSATTGCTELSTPPGGADGGRWAAKGEGLAGPMFYGPAFGGRGNMANGAGGGNCLSSGGGGGANASAGGQGGRTSILDGAGRAVGGMGGAPVNASSLINRLVLGGGGGAGQGAAGSASSGGSGGGAIFVRAKTINGTGRITADGQTASGSLLDGAGGGGAGGTVSVRAATAIHCGFAISAAGGKGGSATAALSMGPGGGGGGGNIFVQAASLDAACMPSVITGLAGLDVTSNTGWGATTGLTGGLLVQLNNGLLVPLVPSITSVTNGMVLMNQQPVLAGTTTPLADVDVYVDGSLAAVVAADALGNWSYTPLVPFSLGQHTVRAQAKLQGLVSDSSAVVNITIGTPLVDAGNGSDAGTSSDAGNGSDAGNVTDAGSLTDAGNGSDAGNVTDAGTLTDAGNGSDAGNVTDAGTLTDAGSGSDAGNVAEDAGTLTDAGMTMHPDNDGGTTGTIDAGTAAPDFRSGCGCNSSGFSSMLLALLAFGLRLPLGKRLGRRPRAR